MDDLPNLADFPARTTEILRFGDTDALGHVNNAVVATMYEGGRIGALSAVPQHPGCSVVIVRLVIDFRGELLWPGTVEVGTRLTKIGTSSLTFTQALFQKGRCVSTSESVLVYFDMQTRKAMPLSEDVRAVLRRLAPEA